VPKAKDMLSSAEKWRKAEKIDELARCVLFPDDNLPVGQRACGCEPLRAVLCLSLLLLMNLNPP
jgi:hypothetical protein